MGRSRFVIYQNGIYLYHYNKPKKKRFTRNENFSREPSFSVNHSSPIGTMLFNCTVDKSYLAQSSLSPNAQA